MTILRQLYQLFALEQAAIRTAHVKISCAEEGLPPPVRSIRLIAGGLDLLVDEVGKGNLVFFGPGESSR